jgi:hypothetical protein
LSFRLMTVGSGGTGFMSSFYFLSGGKIQKQTG